MILSIPALLIGTIATVLIFLLRTRRPHPSTVLAVVIIVIALILTTSNAAQYLEPVLRLILGAFSCPIT